MIKRIVNCACGAILERFGSNGKTPTCFDCKRKKKAENTKAWYRKSINKERRSVWDKETRRFKQEQNASDA